MYDILSNFIEARRMVAELAEAIENAGLSVRLRAMEKELQELAVAYEKDQTE